MGRTNFNKYMRVYADGYDLSGYTRIMGPLSWEFEASEDRVLTSTIKGVLCDIANITPGTLNGVFDNTETSGLHAVASGAGTQRTMMAPIGLLAAPDEGDPVFMGVFQQVSYMASPSSSGETLNAMLEFGGPYQPTRLNYDKPWGVLLHANGEETEANSTTGEGVDNDAASSAGGYLMYQIFSVTGEGTVTISIDDSADDSSYSALSGATSGAIAHGDVPAAGVVQLGTGATVKQYLRWQIAFDTITACTFALAFVRG